MFFQLNQISSHIGLSAFCRSVFSPRRSVFTNIRQLAKQTFSSFCSWMDGRPHSILSFFFCNNNSHFKLFTQNKTIPVIRWNMTEERRSKLAKKNWHENECDLLLNSAGMVLKNLLVSVRASQWCRFFFPSYSEFSQSILSKVFLCARIPSASKTAQTGHKRQNGSLPWKRLVMYSLAYCVHCRQNSLELSIHSVKVTWLLFSWVDRLHSR